MSKLKFFGSKIQLLKGLYRIENHTKVGGRYLGDLSYAMFYGELPGHKQCPKLLLLVWSARTLGIISSWS